MDYYYENIGNAIHYIEENLTNELSLSQIISCTGFSKYHFARIFKTISGYTIYDYIRRRRLTEAAKLLTNTDMRIIDISMLYGYLSQEAFTRAFKEMFSVTPYSYRVNKFVFENLYEQVLSYEFLSHTSDTPLMEPIIVEKESFLITGLEYAGQNSNNEVPKLWNEFCREIKPIEQYVKRDVYYGLERYDEQSWENCCFRYLAGAEITQYDERIFEYRNVVKIEKSSYAVFPLPAVIHTLPKEIAKVYTTYLPKTGLKIKGDYDFEYYDRRFRANDKESVIYLHVPIES